MQEIKDVQKDSYRKLLQERIPELIRGASTVVHNGYSLVFEPMESNNSVRITSPDDTEYYSIKAVCRLCKEGEGGDFVEFVAELLRVPVLQELGFKIKGNYMQRLDEYERSRGWSFYRGNKGDYAKLLSENNRSVCFEYGERKIPQVSFSIRGQGKHKVSPATFLSAVSGYSFEELVSVFGYSNPFVIEIFSGNVKMMVEGEMHGRNDCIKAVADAMFGDVQTNPRTHSVMLREIKDNLFSSKYFPLGSGNAKRLNYLQSYSYRANGCVLAEDVSCNGYKFGRGAVLGNKELAVLDALPLDKLKVEYHSKIYELRKFSKFTFQALGCTLGQDVEELGLKSGKRLDEADVRLLNDSSLSTVRLADGSFATRRRNAVTLTCDDLFTAFSIWTDNLNGIGRHEKQYEVSNRILVPFDKMAESLVSRHLGMIVQNISNNLSLADFGESIAMAVNDCCKGIEQDAFIASVTSKKKNSGQMSDMCNIMSFVSKSSKAVSQVPTDAVTQDMVSVQDLQEGRLDPLDVPESDKIGRVHYRTMLSKLDDEGALLSPFLRVVNGVVVDKEPVYLTAIEEADRCIAEWDETFHNADGSLKTRIRTRCNGDVQYVELSRVEFKEFSPYQNLSTAHSMVPFPGHSNGKRITMACNQVKQAVPVVDPERPYVAAGGESLLDVGTYKARDVLEQYYEENRVSSNLDRKVVMNSKIKLLQTTTGIGKKTLFFQVLAVSAPNTVSLTVPYLFRNFESAMFSYNINPMKDNIYEPDDVVCYNNGYSLEKKELVMCADFGGQEVSPNVFDKGIALVKNLNVVYKTCEGSTIEDGILISNRLVYDDTLTHIGMFDIRETLAGGDGFTEFFGISKDSPSYLETNGLPRVGTELKYGMPVIGKVCYSGKRSIVKYVRVPTYVEGQVISADIKQSYKGTEAVVVLAQRSYVQTGDKFAGRCGNKGVVARILPHSEMPYCKDDGTVADVVLNPLGVPSRMNITQLLEAALSMCMRMEDKYAIVTPYHADDTDFVREQARQHGVVPKVMVDGRTGQEFVRPINFGVLPLYKLHHVAKRKIHSVGMDAKLDSAFLQPMKGSKQRGGQSIGEMETWCLEAAGAMAFLQDLFSFQSDDAMAREDTIQEMRGFPGNCGNGKNDNDLAMQACFRSLGVEFVSNQEEKCYEFHPLKDSTIKSFAPYPVSNETMLHSTAIFGRSNKLAERIDGRKNWGWIDLHTKMVMPLWIMKGTLGKVIGMPSTQIGNILDGKVYVHKEVSVNVETVEEKELALMDDATKDKYLSGMQAIVHVFENFNTVAREIFCRSEIEEYTASHEDYYNSGKYKSLLANYRAVRDFNKNGDRLSDYVVTAMPVMPQTYRPVIQVSGRQMVPDFDWYYTQILHAAGEVERNASNQTVYELYGKILAFSGLGGSPNSKYQNLLNYFSGKNRNSHGKIRENVQSKRVLCSGRAAIKPAEDITRTPLELGVPFTMVVKMWFEPIYGRYREMTNTGKLPSQGFEALLMALAHRDFTEFRRLYQEHFLTTFSYTDARSAYDGMTEDICKLMKGHVVSAGRQPSLHKYSVRAYHPYIVYDYMIHIHPLLCTPYNADFDGDQMYVVACLTEASKQNALETLSPDRDFILPKDSSMILEHKQDIALGIYCATMLKDNAVLCEAGVGDIFYYDSTDAVKMDLFSGMIHAWDLVSLSLGERRYLSTAGRIIFHSFLPHGFTDQPFTNPLRIKGIKQELYFGLAYDGIIGSGKLDKGGMQYYSLQQICRETYDHVGSDCMAAYQAISEFGFRMSDLFGISLSLYDFDIESNKQALLDEAEKLKDAVEQDYQDGLIAEEDKRNAMIAIYADSRNGVSDKIIGDLLNHLPRNNNIFIMMDSGARGNKSQLMHMCGAVGILQKTKVEDLESAVTGNYYEGLGSFDVHLASYSARTGVASTQNETRNAGYATRQVVYMASGIQVVEEDCGKAQWDFEVEWGNHNESKDSLLPSEKWFREHLLGKVLANECPEGLQAISDHGVLTMQSFERMQVTCGFHEFPLKEGTVVVSIFNAKGKRVLDRPSKVLLKYVGEKLSMRAFDALLRKKVKSFKTEDGVYSIRYDMDACCKSMMRMRVARNLPFLKKVRDEITGIEVHTVTDKTIAWIEDNGVDSVEVRTVLDCCSKHGICAKCYGLDYSSLQLPEVGSYVGIDSAQSIGEPAAQLTLNVINKGGVSGASNISSGVDVFEALLRGGLPQGEGRGATVAGNSGYLRIDKMDNSAVVRIEPENIRNSMCAKCLEENRVQFCPAKDNRLLRALHCQLSAKQAGNNLIQNDGEWVDSGDAITFGMVHPESIHSVRDNVSPEIVHVKRQRIWIHNYFETFRGSGVAINARHFELIANVQNKYVEVVNAGTTNLELGKVYEYNEVRDSLDDIDVRQFVCKKDEAILWNSGAFAAISFENVANVAANLVTKGFRSSTEHNHSLIGSLSVGENMVTREIKQINRPNVAWQETKEQKQEEHGATQMFRLEEAVPRVDTVDAFSFDDFDFGMLDQRLNLQGNTNSSTESEAAFDEVETVVASLDVADAAISDFGSDDGAVSEERQEQDFDLFADYNNSNGQSRTNRLNAF